MSEDEISNDDEIKVSDEDRSRAHQALDQWLDQSHREAGSAFERGRSGHLGEFKLSAYSDDEGVSLTVERTFLEAL